METMPKLIAIVGTNASGKSGLGVELAARYGGEIVSADSRQIYRGLDLGSGKITPDEMRGVPHHLIDVREPGDFFSMADFQRMAYGAIDGIAARGRLPFLVGGTGLYVDCVTDGYLLSDIKPDLQYRDELEKLDTPALAAMLRACAPDAVFDANNRNRVMRALERLHDGDTLSARRAPRYDVLKIGVTWERDALCARIDERLERRMRAGLIAEVKGLLDAGVSDSFLRKLGLEYRYVTEYLLGDIASEAEMTEELARAIKRFAKRQMTWFRRDARVVWLDMAGDPIHEACALIDRFLSGKA